MFECCNKKNKLTWRQVLFATYAAYIRGAIAFGLSQNLKDEHFGNHVDGHSEGEAAVIQNCMLSLVILTTVIIGGFTPLVQKCLVPPADAHRATDSKLGLTNGPIERSQLTSKFIDSNILLSDRSPLMRKLTVQYNRMTTTKNESPKIPARELPAASEQPPPRNHE